MQTLDSHHDHWCESKHRRRIEVGNHITIDFNTSLFLVKYHGNTFNSGKSQELFYNLQFKCIFLFKTFKLWIQSIIFIQIRGININLFLLLHFSPAEPTCYDWRTWTFPVMPMNRLTIMNLCFWLCQGRQEFCAGVRDQNFSANSYNGLWGKSPQRHIWKSEQRLSLQTSC